MEYLQQYNPQVISADPSSQENQGSGGFPLRRSRSIELRAGKLYPTCECIKRNGLQNDCRRTECQGKSCCMTKSGPTCSPSTYASKLMSYSMGSGNGFGRRGTMKEREVKIQRQGESKLVKSEEIPMTNDSMTTEDYSEIKDFDPKMLGQFYQSPTPAMTPYSQFSPTQMIGQPMTTFPQNFAGMTVPQPTTISSQPISISTKSGGASKTGNQTSSANQAMINGMALYPGMPQGNQISSTNQPILNGMTAYPGMSQGFGSPMTPISAIEPVPTIHPLPAGNSFQGGIPIGQPYISGQTFTPFNGNMSSINPYSPNVSSYLPCGPASMPSMTTGIPVGTAQ